MPVYVFRCVKCNAEFEKTMTVAKREKAGNVPIVLQKGRRAMRLR